MQLNARVEQARSRLKQVSEAGDRAAEGDKARVKELFDLGKACCDKRDYDQAIAYYTEAIRLDAKDCWVYSESHAGTEPGPRSPPHARRGYYRPRCRLPSKG